MYINAPHRFRPITIYNGKVPRIKKAKPEEVPEAYRKVKLNTKIKAKLKSYASNICLYFVGITELIRKGIEYERNGKE